MKQYTDLNTPPRLLLGPGPSTVHPRVLRAMAHPLVGHLDPQFIALMNEVQEMLRVVFQTENQGRAARRWRHLSATLSSLVTRL
jgi:alanine-glyoxylate transaminase/serine-glyoxylate transaminase/serine-pyruvate transaminase